jgi:hypothetical protein
VERTSGSVQQRYIRRAGRWPGYDFCRTARRIYRSSFGSIERVVGCSAAAVILEVIMELKRGLAGVAVVLMFACVADGWAAADVVIVEEVQEQTITTQDGRVYKVDDKTAYAKKTEDGEVKAKLGDLKPGTTIEVQMQKGAKVVKKVVIHRG